MTEAGPPRCETCGYDLRSNESGQCPECGARAPRQGRMPPQWWILGVVIGVGALLIAVAAITRWLELL